jgi:pimeloyl-ACP methyl ester carboxylesterase
LTETYVNFEGAQLAVRSQGDWGQATPVLLLHHAPGSSRLYESAMLAIGEKHPVLALDLPGHGESDALPGNPQDHATWVRAVAHVLDHMGVKRVHVWGHQGGAALACALAVQHPDKVASVVLDAPLWADAATRARLMADGIPDVNPSWEGAHWLRAWHHARDAELWWPWFDRRMSQRKPQPSQIDPVRLNAWVLEAMKQPDSYAGAWRAHWSFDWAGQWPQVKAPLHCTTALNDTYAHLSLYPPQGMPTAVSHPSEEHLQALSGWWQKNAP